MSDYAKFIVEEDGVVSAWMQSSPHGGWVKLTPIVPPEPPRPTCVVYPGDDWLVCGEGWDWPITYSDGTQLGAEFYTPEQRARGLNDRT
jgi:hypothetical protein